MIEYHHHVTRDMLRARPDALFVFGDNMCRAGRGGQAREMRGEPNAVGIPTKGRPTMEEDAFLRDTDAEAWFRETRPDLGRLLTHDGPVCWPRAGIGTGLAQLDVRAPLIYALIDGVRRVLEEGP